MQVDRNVVKRDFCVQKRPRSSWTRLWTTALMWARAGDKFCILIIWSLYLLHLIIGLLIYFNCSLSSIVLKQWTWDNLCLYKSRINFPQVYWFEFLIKTKFFLIDILMLRIMFYQQICRKSHWNLYITLILTNNFVFKNDIKCAR